MKEIKSFFATHIYYTQLSTKANTNKINKKIIEEVEILKERDFVGKKWCQKNYPGGYTTYNSIPNLHQRSDSILQLEKKIKPHVIKYASALGLDLCNRKLSVSEMWINVMPKQVTHGLHIHPLSIISGTYYVDTPKNCAAIKFEDPRLGFFMASPPRTKTATHSQDIVVDFPAIAGNLVLFESWLRHEVPPNQSDTPRISVSFNYAWE
jgi:uncharacterized protein (TIGR02466 family)